MNIQERILTILKPLVASKGFSPQTVQGLATNLGGGLTEESTDEDITTAINGAMPVYDLMQSENTRYVNEYKKKNPTPANPAPANPPTDPPAPTGSDALIAELTKKVDSLLQQNESLSLTDKWNKLAEANGFTNATLIDKWKPSSEEEFEQAIAELQEFNKDFVKQQANDRSPGKPNSGEPDNGGGGKPKELTAKGKEALEGFRKANERRAKK